MRKGAIPVPHIVALILGIIVIGLLAFWFFVLGGRIDPKVQECEGDKREYCITWSGCGYGECEPYGGDWDAYAPGCTDVGVNRPNNQECVQIITGRKPPGSACTSNGDCASGSCTEKFDVDGNSLGWTCD